MPSHREYPNSLWLQVLGNVPKDTLPAVSLTNKTLRRLVRPLRFTHLDFHPYARDYGQGILLLPSSEEVERSMERLHFWRSDEIAFFVRSIKISPWDKSESPWTFSPADSPYILQDLLFTQLQSFTRLQRLNAEFINFTGTAISSLARMSALQHLSIEECGVVAEGDLDLSRQTLALSGFTLDFGPYMDVSADAAPKSYTLRPWLPLLRPDHLLELHLNCDIRIWSENPSAIPDFANVRRLFIHLRPVSEINRNFEILSKFRNVEVLTLARKSWLAEKFAVGTQDSELPVLSSLTGHVRAQDAELPVLSSLKEFTGHCDYLSVARRAALTHLSTNFGTSDQLMTQLQPLHNPTTITSLVIEGVQPLDDTALVTILTLCTGLVEFKLFYLKESFGKAASLCRALPRTPSLPLTLKSLCLCGWEFQYDMFAESKRLRGPEFQEIRAALVSQCPALTSLWFSGSCFAFQWRKYADQTIAEESAEGFHPATLMRVNLNEFWRTREL